jgi:hypothetical protein
MYFLDQQTQTSLTFPSKLLAFDLLELGSSLIIRKLAF